MSEFSYSKAGLTLTKSFEGLRLEAYRDAGGVWTVGYGHTGPDVFATQRITEPEADRLLRADLAASIAFVNRVVTAKITQPQFDALVDFCFNAGCGHLEHSTLLKKVNAGDAAGAAAQFGAWVLVDGQAVAGLVRRRAAEAELFRKGIRAIS